MNESKLRLGLGLRVVSVQMLLPSACEMLCSPLIAVTLPPSLSLSALSLGSPGDVCVRACVWVGGLDRVPIYLVIT